jgi:hypothetical protein
VPNSVSWPELVFTLTAVAGLFFSFLNFRHTLGDMRALRAMGIRNGRRFVAVHFLLGESIRAAIQLIHLVIGGLAMDLPNAPASPPGFDRPLKVDIYAYSILYGLIVSAALVGLLSAHAWWWRRHYPIGRPDGG